MRKFRRQSPSTNQLVAQRGTSPQRTGPFLFPTPFELHVPFFLLPSKQFNVSNNFSSLTCFADLAVGDTWNSWNIGQLHQRSQGPAFFDTFLTLMAAFSWSVQVYTTRNEWSEQAPKSNLAAARGLISGKTKSAQDVHSRPRGSCWWWRRRGAPICAERASDSAGHWRVIAGRSDNPTPRTFGEHTLTPLDSSSCATPSAIFQQKIGQSQRSGFSTV